MNISKEEARKLIEDFRKKYPETICIWNREIKVKAYLRTMGQAKIIIELPLSSLSRQDKVDIFREIAIEMDILHELENAHPLIDAYLDDTPGELAPEDFNNPPENDEAQEDHTGQDQQIIRALIYPSE